MVVYKYEIQKLALTSFFKTIYEEQRKVKMMQNLFFSDSLSIIGPGKNSMDSSNK